MKASIWFGISLVAASALLGCERRDRTPAGQEEPLAEERAPLAEREREEVVGPEREEVVGQEREAEAMGRTESVVGTASAIQRITQARCERELRCDNIGAGKEYASKEACMSEIGTEWKDELNAIECPDGIVEKELNECLEEVRNEDCANPFDTLGRVVACRESDLCNAM